MRKSNISNAANQYYFILLMMILLLMSSMKIIRLMIFYDYISIPFH